MPWLRKRWARAFCAFYSLRRAGVSPNRWVLAPAPGKGEAMKWKSSILSSPRRPAVSKVPAVTCATQTIHNVQHSDELVKRYDATLHLCSTFRTKNKPCIASLLRTCMDSNLSLEGAAAAALSFLPGWPAPVFINVLWHTIGDSISERTSILLSRRCAGIISACTAMTHLKRLALASHA